MCYNKFVRQQTEAEVSLRGKLRKNKLFLEKTLTFTLRQMVY